MVLSASAGLILIGALVILIFEFTNTHTLQPLSPVGKLLSSLLQSVSSRSAGINTIDIPSMRQATQFFIIIMMFIGASPGSSGGASR